MPTSLLFAYIGLMISNEKRKREDRMRAHEFLKALIDRMAVHHPRLQFLFSDLQGNAMWVEQELTTPYSCLPWRTDFFATYLQMTWLGDLASQSKPWITSHPVEGQIHLADFISFSLDMPSWLRRKCNQELLWGKQIAERSSLSLLTQMAAIVEEKISDLTSPLNRAIMREARLNKHQKWALVAQAMDMVFSQQDPSHLQWQDLYIYSCVFPASSMSLWISILTLKPYHFPQHSYSRRSLTGQGEIPQESTQPSGWQEDHRPISSFPCLRTTTAN